MTVPGGYVAGDILTAANLNLLPGGKMGYAQVTANQTSIGNAEADLTSLTVTWTAVSARRYRISFFVNLTMQTSLIGEGAVYITDGSNTHKLDTGLPQPEAIDTLTTLVGSVTETGLSGATTRKLRARRLNGGGDTMSLAAAATYPAYILVEDIGPA